MTGAGGATGMLWAGFITGGLGLYILGSAVFDGLGRSPFALSKTLPGASNEVKMYRPFCQSFSRDMSLNRIYVMN